MGRVLVTVASKHGATEEIGQAIATAISEEGFNAQVQAPERVATLEGVDAVIVGSGIYAGHWLEAAKRFIERHGEALRQRPVWLFSSGPIGDPLKPEEDPDDAEPIATRLGARAHRVFGGRLDRARLGLGERAIVGLVRAPDGDFRPWDEIRSWGAEIARDLRAG